MYRHSFSCLAEFKKVFRTDVVDHLPDSETVKIKHNHNLLSVVVCFV